MNLNFLKTLKLESVISPAFTTNLLLFFVPFLISLISLNIFKKIVLKKLIQMSKKTKTNFDDFLLDSIKKIGSFFYIIVSIFIGLNFVNLGPEVNNISSTGFLIVLFFYGVKFIQRFVDYFSDIFISSRKDKSDESVIKLISSIAKSSLWLFAFLIIFQNLGYDVTALIAGLSIGGLAIGIALRGILEDVFSFFSIQFDKPFKVGDYISFGNKSGTVKHIGIKSTRIKASKGEEVVVSNANLIDSIIHNSKKMQKRRATFSLGIEYGTPVKKLKKIPLIIKKIFKKHDIADLVRVHFTEFGDFSLLYKITFYTNIKDYQTYLDVLQKINFEIVEVFEKEKIEMAFPTQTIHLKK